MRRNISNEGARPPQQGPACQPRPTSVGSGCSLWAGTRGRAGDPASHPCRPRCRASPCVLRHGSFPQRLALRSRHGSPALLGEEEAVGSLCHKTSFGLSSLAPEMQYRICSESCFGRSDRAFWARPPYLDRKDTRQSLACLSSGSHTVPLKTREM